MKHVILAIAISLLSISATNCSAADGIVDLLPKDDFDETLSDLSGDPKLGPLLYCAEFLDLATYLKRSNSLATQPVNRKRQRPPGDYTSDSAEDNLSSEPESPDLDYTPAITGKDIQDFKKGIHACNKTSIEKGANILCRHTKYQHLLDWALGRMVAAHRASIVEILLKYGANPEKVEKVKVHGSTRGGAEENDIKIQEMLRNKKAELHSQSARPPMKSALAVATAHSTPAPVIPSSLLCAGGSPLNEDALSLLELLDS